MLGLPPLLWPLHGQVLPSLPAGVGPQMKPPVWRALRVMVQGFWFLYQFLMKKSLLLVEPIAHGGPRPNGMNRRDFSPGRKSTEEPILTLEPTFHSCLQLNIIPSLCFFFAAAL